MEVLLLPKSIRTLADPGVVIDTELDRYVAQG